MAWRSWSGRCSAFAIGADLVVVVGGPADQRGDDLVQSAAQRGEGVLDARRDLGVGGAGDQAVLVELAKGEAEHALGNAGDLPLQVGVAQRSGLQDRDDQQAPLVADAVEGLADEVHVLGRDGRARPDRRRCCRRLCSVDRLHDAHSSPARTPVCLLYCLPCWPTVALRTSRRKWRYMMKVNIWAEVTCPWCGLGSYRLATAVERFEHADEVELVHHSFPLSSSFPEGDTFSVREALLRRYGIGGSQAETSTRRIEKLAESEGLTPYQVLDNKVGNTDLAHEFLAHASAQGKNREAWDAIFTTYFGRAEPVFSLEDL